MVVVEITNKGLKISTYCSTFPRKVEEGIRSILLRHVF